jgi:serine/threonine protein kinase/Flp pilus assembly protein TadD
MDIEKNRVISHYKILSSIGKGGMGEVYLAQDTKLNRKVAIKFLSDEFSRDSDKLNRFVQEAQAASALNHPNIVTIHEIGDTDDSRYIALEYIEGETLTKFLRKRLSFEKALDIAAQLASALDAAHSAGIIHRDIKPDNVMIRPDGVVKILDFGIAKLTEQPRPEAEPEDKTAVQVNTSPGMIIGTANYMSPEQAKGKEIDSRTDIFSFGVLLYEMVSGHLPFFGDSPLEIIGSILHKEPAPIGNQDVPPELERIVSKSLRKDPDERYQTMKGLLADLKAAKRELDIQDHLERTVPPHQTESDTEVFQATTAEEADQLSTAQTMNDSISIKRSSVGRVLTGFAAILVLTAIGIGYWYYFGSSTGEIESIAVMPFVNESGDPNIEYLSDGMAETLINSLSEIPDLSVKARSLVFQYKGKQVSPGTLASELGVQAILTGRVVQRGEQVSLSVELIDGTTQNTIWGKKYERSASGLVTLQNELARDVSGRLRSKAKEEEATKTETGGTDDPAAYQAYLKGRFYWNKRNAEDMKKAIEQFTIATEKDPGYALAFSGLADCYAIFSEYTGTPASESIPKAKAFAEKALSLDKTLGAAHATLGSVNMSLWDWEAAEREFKTAIELDPDYPTAYHWYSVLLRYLGRFDESAMIIRRAADLDPLSVIIQQNVANVQMARGDFKAGLETTSKVIDLAPDFAYARIRLGQCYLGLGRSADAIASLEKVLEMTNRESDGLSELGFAYAFAGRRDEALGAVRELEARFDRKEAQGTNVALVYVGLGERDKVFEWLEKDFKTRDSELATIRWEPNWEPIRNDPRYADLIKRMGLPE